MPDRIEFETPENVQVSYELAGLGTRFLAWLIDSILLGVFYFVMIIVALIAGAASEKALRDLSDSLRHPTQPGELPSLPLYFVMFIAISFWICTVIYYGLSELLMRGQTIGKRSLSVRVVKANGFSLDSGSIFLRNVFRLIDHIPVVWVVPYLSKRAQRLGDMVAGTVVVTDATSKMSHIAEQLLRRSPADAMFQFSVTALTTARPGDLEAVERLLERWPGLKPPDREKLLNSICPPLAKRLNMEPPDQLNRLRFLEEFLAAEYRRQYRQLS